LKLAYFPGCQISTQEFGYELSLRALLPELGVELVDTPGFSCCGMPMRHINLNVSLYLGLRNIAVAEKEGLDLFAPCPQCHLSLAEAKNAVDKNPDLLVQMNEKLATEELEYKGTAALLHTLEVLHSNIDILKEKVTKPVGKLVAAHYGCHSIRYSDAGRPDHSESPHKIEDVLEAIGCETKGYPERLNCCGGPWLANEVASGLTKSGQKLKAVADHGFDGLCHVCPWGHRMMDVRQQEAATTVAASFSIPVFYLTQLVGLALGIDEKKLGLHLNQSNTENFLDGGGAESTHEGNSSDPPGSSSPLEEGDTTVDEPSQEPTEGGGE